MFHSPPLACSIFMASNTPSHLFFLIVFLTTLPLQPLSSDLDSDYQKWVSWNVENYRKKILTDPKAKIRSPNGGWKALDAELRKAEEEMVRVSVRQDGLGNYTSITAALDSIPRQNRRRVVMEISPGLYREKIVIPKSLPFITFIGNNAKDPPTITWNDTAATLGPNGMPLKTYHSATVAINSNYFVASNMRFENKASYPEDGTIGGQAVALRISGNKAAFYNCYFYGFQDTLYDHKGLHYFNNSFIQGSVDFIFGYGRSLYENCYLNSIAKNLSAMTAQKRSNVSLDSGFSFTKSRVNGSGMVYLGRAWGDHSRVVYSYTYMDKVAPEGWNNWDKPERELTVYYGEYKCSGPGANTTGRVAWAKQLSDEEAQPFLGIYYVDGYQWLGSAGI